LDPGTPQPARSRGGELVRYPLVNDEAALLWMVEFGCIDLHVWTSRRDRPDRPDVVLFDLDPAGVPFADVARAALLLRDALSLFGLESVPMTTGGGGMHVRVPIARRHGYEQARGFADVVARALVRSSDGLVTVERSLARRHGVFVDTKMNGHGQQIVAPYSLRPVPTAAIATPLSWDEVGAELDPAAFGMAAVLERVASTGDVAEPLLRGRQSLGRALARLG
jgi:bifunctional non-homologous end joining protein LigD